MGKFGYKITLSEEAYRNFRRLKEELGARSWEELSRMLLNRLVRKHNSSKFKSSFVTADKARGYEPATKKQLSYLRKLVSEYARSKGVSEDEAVEEIARELGFRICDEMSRVQATQAISALEKLLGEE